MCQRVSLSSSGLLLSDVSYIYIVLIKKYHVHFRISYTMNDEGIFRSSNVNDKGQDQVNIFKV